MLSTHRTFFRYFSGHFPDTGTEVGIFGDGVDDSCDGGGWGGGCNHVSPHIKRSDCNPGDRRPGLLSPSASLVTHGCGVSYLPPSSACAFSPP